MKIEKLNAWALKPLRKLRVAIYVRVSSLKQLAEESLENQVKSLTEQIAATPGWELAEVYADFGVSGTLKDRSEFQRMLRDCRNGKIDIILTKSFTRFGRNTVMVLETLRELKDFGIDVIFEKDHIRSLSESGELLITLLAAFAQAESQSASENQRWRIKKCFEDGRLAGGTNIYGYRLKDGKLEVHPAEARVVRFIFKEFMSGKGALGIAKLLNEQGIPAYNGGFWNRRSVQFMLKNEKYTGNMILQKTYHKDYISKKKMINHGEKPRYYVENSHEAIIPKADFDAVQKEMAHRAALVQPRSKDAPKKYLFTSMVQCGQCDKFYKRKVSRAKTDREKVIWSCSTLQLQGKDSCNNQQISEHILRQKTAEVLGTEDLEKAVSEKLKVIIATEPGLLTFVFLDGHRESVHWENPSRRESWTPEMREKARQRAFLQHGKEAK